MKLEVQILSDIEYQIFMIYQIDLSHLTLLKDGGVNWQHYRYFNNPNPGIETHIKLILSHPNTFIDSLITCAILVWIFLWWMMLPISNVTRDDSFHKKWLQTWCFLLEKMDFLLSIWCQMMLCSSSSYSVLW